MGRQAPSRGARRLLEKPLANSGSRVKGHSERCLGGTLSFSSSPPFSPALLPDLSCSALGSCSFAPAMLSTSAPVCPPAAVSLAVPLPPSPSHLTPGVPWPSSSPANLRQPAVHGLCARPQSLASAPSTCTRDAVPSLSAAPIPRSGSASIRRMAVPLPLAPPSGAPGASAQGGKKIPLRGGDGTEAHLPNPPPPPPWSPCREGGLGWGCPTCRAGGGGGSDPNIHGSK